MEVKAETAGEQKETDIPGQGRGKGLLWIALGTVIFLLAATYFGMTFYYSTRYFPRTTINGEDYGNADKNTVEERLKSDLRNYQLKVTGLDPKSEEESQLFTITAQDVGMDILINETDAEILLNQQNEWMWPTILLGQNYRYIVVRNVTVDEDKLTAFLEEQPAFQPQNMIEPHNAYIKGYSEEEKQFVLVEEVVGTQLKQQMAVEAVKEAICGEERLLNLEEAGCYVKPTVTAQDADLQAMLQEANKWLETKITYDWNTNPVVLNGEQIKEWITIEAGKPVLDEEAVAAFVKENAQKFDTYGKYRQFVTTLGIKLTLPSGVIGWQTDQEAETEALKELIKSGAVEEREPVYSFEGPQKGMNDIGNTYIEADMTHQHMYLYKNGELRLETDFVSGNMSAGDATPQGVFRLNYKMPDAILRGADWEDFVYYWMPFHGNYGMHDATWRDEFGGNIYLTNGSHGCLNLPLDKAGEIYSSVEIGIPVICYYYPAGVLESLAQNAQE